MEFKILRYTVTIGKSDFPIDDPENWPAHHQRRALKRAKARCPARKIPYMKEVREYAKETFGEACGLKKAKEFIDKRYPELPFADR